MVHTRTQWAEEIDYTPITLQFYKHLCPSIDFVTKKEYKLNNYG